jgi:hypothetical protein
VTCVKLWVAIATTVYHSDTYTDTVLIGLINTISVRNLEVGHSDLVGNCMEWNWPKYSDVKLSYIAALSFDFHYEWM